MSIKKILLPSLLIGSMLGLIRSAINRTTSQESPPTNDTYKNLDDYVEEQVRRLKIPAVSMAIVEGDRIVHYRGFGRARPGGEAPTLQTPFFIGSVTKSITALAIMQLVEAGKVELDAPVQHYLPWFRVADPVASAQMTVRHLLNHTSGLSMLQGQEILSKLDEKPVASERQLRSLSTIKLSHPVGTKFAYNNTNYNLLGLIIEAASGELYPDYIQEHIFAPLEMRHSYISKADAQQDSLAMGHRYWFGFPVAEPNLPQPMGSLPSGQLISCAEDMAHYLVAQLNGGRYGEVQILSSAGIEEMQRGTTEIIVMGKMLGFYGMGWETTDTGRSHIVWHSGIVPEYGAFAGLVPGQMKGIILLYNANHAMIKLTFDEFGLGAAERLAGEVPSRKMAEWMPWLMRGMLLIPVLQIAGVMATLRKISHWRTNPESRPGCINLWGRHILLPLLPNLMVASSLIPVLGKMGGWMQLFMPDFVWLARLCGGFALVWSFLRTGLITRAMRK